MTAHALLIGGIGSGKSAAAEAFTALGAFVLCADDAAHRVLAPGGAAEAAVAGRWPDAVHDGRIDRRALGRLVFADPGELAALEALTHPAIGADLAAKVAEAHGPLVLVEMPLPAGPIGREWPRIVVDAPEELRIFRLRLRGMDPAEIAQRMAVQPTRDEWLALADHVVDNTGGPDDLERECRRVWGELVGSEAH